VTEIEKACRNGKKYFRKAGLTVEFSFIIDIFYSPGDQIEKNEMGRACSTYTGKEQRIQDFDRET
jgi:hypothetical protein